MPTTELFKPAGGTVVRITQVDECGNPLTGGCYAVSKCWAQATFQPQYNDGQEFAPMNADGSLCYAERQPPSLKWLFMMLRINAVDPVLWSILTGAATVLDDAVAPNTVGYRLNRGDILTSRFAFEVWQRQSGACAPGQVPYIYDLLPFIVQARVAEDSIGTGGQESTVISIEQGLVKAPSAWGIGPYFMRKDAVTGAPEKLLTAIRTAAGAEDFRHRQITTLAPPAPTSGCQLIAPVMTVSPLSGAHPLAVVATIPLGGDGLPILPGTIDWGDLSTSVITSGTTAPHSYASAGTFTATYTPSSVSSPIYTSAPVVVA